jgi:hypothetical protein
LLRRQDGSSTIEFIVWMPVFLIIVGLTADVATTYLIQASMWNTAMDCTRRMSTGQYTSSQTSPNDVTTACVKKELLFSYKFSKAGAAITPTFGSTDDSIEIQLPLWEAGMFGVLASFAGLAGNSYKLDVKATMKAET